MADWGTPPSKQSRRVVIIDDESAFADFMNKLINGLGDEVIVSTDARSSDIYELRDSDIVFIDVMMPNMDGLQVLEKLFRQEAKCSIVLMSGHGERLEAAEKLAKQLDLRLIGALEKTISPS
jgi:CheY-like chemotaxis protein